MTATFTVRATYPCCDKPARFAALDGFPRETYTRRCRPCETTFLVERSTIERGGVRIDRLDWTDTATRLYRHRYG